MRFSSLEEWLAWQENCHPREIDLGLDRVGRVAKRMGLLAPEATVITVAGTNGKGSCVATLEAVLQAQGKTTGAYTSPHLLHYNERVRLAGAPAEDHDLCRAFAAIDEARGDISLSYFEFGTLAAFWLFREYQLDYWLLEVGLGGRLDATNLLDADIAVVTSIALDHQQFLGNDREAIGREKAGIFRAGRPVVCADLEPPESVIGHAQALECPFYLAGRDFSWQYNAGAHPWQVSLGAVAGPLALPPPELPPASVAAALQVLALLGVLPGEKSLAACLAGLQLAGRFQSLVYQGRTVYLDVAHNPAAVQYLAMRLDEGHIRGLSAIVAIMADKDVHACLKPLLGFVSHWHLAALPDVPRAASPQQLQVVLAGAGIDPDRITCHGSVAEALSHVVEPTGFHCTGAPDEHSPLLVTGSFYTVAAALPVLGNTHTKR